MKTDTVDLLNNIRIAMALAWE